MYLLEQCVVEQYSTEKKRAVWNNAENCPYKMRLKNMAINMAFIPPHPAIPVLVKFNHNETFLHNQFLAENANHIKTHMCSAHTLLVTIFMQQKIFSTKIAKNQKRKFMFNKTCSIN
jgi:hypothetical protein